MSASGSQRQPSAFQNIKLFPQSNTASSALWYLNSSGSNISPANSANVLIPKDLIVEGSILNPSDLHLKENIELLSQDKSFDVNGVLKLFPVKYNYINDTNNKLHYGLIAQDVEEYFPELVHTTNRDETDKNSTATQTKSVNYIELIPIMLCKMQKMQKEIDMLKMSIDGKL
jgi:hypothetical protein